MEEIALKKRLSGTAVQLPRVVSGPLTIGIDIGDGTIPAFAHVKKKNMTLKATTSSMKQIVDSDGTGIKVPCNGIKVIPSSGKKPATRSNSNTKCKVDELDYEIWK
ncbi:hypothetical protein K1719_005237 [Acacia pycnantha]|nr:hypothetical protein K1719_005237 [Acacia pycnantha]